jgi:ketosteroid isomerase-like protein
MAHPNEDLLRKGYAAFAAADLDTLRGLFADDIAWHAPGDNQLSGDFRGQDEVFGLFAKVAELTGGTFRLEIHDVLANDEHGVALVRATGQREGKSLEDRQAHVFHVKDGKVTEFWNHPGDQAAVDEFLS